MTGRRKLGNSDLEISIAGRRGWDMFGAGRGLRKSEQDDQDSRAAIHAALGGSNDFRSDELCHIELREILDRDVGVKRSKLFE